MKHVPKPLLRPFLMGFVTRLLAPSHALFCKDALLVNNKGERFCDELDSPQDHVVPQPSQLAYVALDADVAEKL